MKLGIWVITQSQRIQIEADKKKREALGKSENSTNTSNSPVKKKRASTTKNNAQ